MQLEEFVPYLNLKGINSGDMVDVLRMLVGDAQARFIFSLRGVVPEAGVGR